MARPIYVLPRSGSLALGANAQKNDDRSRGMHFPFGNISSDRWLDLKAPAAVPGCYWRGFDRNEHHGIGEEEIMRFTQRFSRSITVAMVIGAGATAIGLS